MELQRSMFLRKVKFMKDKLRIQYNKRLTAEIILLATAFIISIFPLLISLLDLFFSEIQIIYCFSDLIPWFYVIFISLIVLILEIVFLVHLFGYIKKKHNLTNGVSIGIAVVFHIVVNGLCLLVIRYTVGGSGNDIAKSFYVFLSLIIFELSSAVYLYKIKKRME